MYLDLVMTWSRVIRYSDDILSRHMRRVTDASQTDFKIKAGIIFVQWWFGKPKREIGTHQTSVCIVMTSHELTW